MNIFPSTSGLWTTSSTAHLTNARRDTTAAGCTIVFIYTFVVTLIRYHLTTTGVGSLRLQMDTYVCERLWSRITPSDMLVGYGF